ncbi:MAG: peptidyl-prolyl cis-trans isomerase [Paracoccaceae bacterium]
MNGAFDRDTYRMTLQQSRLKETEFEDKVRGDIARTVLQGATLAGVDAPAGYTERLFAFIGEKREASYVRLTETDLAEPLPAPVDTDLQAYYEAHAADFTQPEAKRITYAALLPEMLRDEVVVDDAALRALYDERRDEFFQPERRLVERLAFATEDEAEAARTAIDAGTTSFDTLVTDRGLTLADVDLGEATETGLGAAGAAVFALNEPGIAGPVATDLGPALFRVNAILEAQETTFEDARDDLTTEFAQDAARRLIGDKVEAIDDALAGGATVEDLAREQGMEVSEVDYYPGLVEGIAAYEDFRKAAEALAEGDFAEAILLDDGGVVAMRLDEVVPPTLKPFADVADAVEDGWHGEALTKALGAQAKEVVAKIAAGEPFGGFGLVTRTGTQTRGGYIDAVPDAMLAEMFTMKPGDIRTIPGDGAVFLLRLDTVEPASTDDEDGKAVHDAIAAQLSQSLAGDAFDLFAAALEAEAGISLNQAAINAVHAQFR